MSEGRLLRPVNAHDTPSGGRWTYVQPATKKPFSQPSLKQLTRDVQKHREAMVSLGRTEEDLDLRPGWYERFLSDVCLHMQGKARCEEYTTADGNPTRRWVGLTEVARWWNTVKDWRAGGKQLVSEQEAERRASICKGCPHNQRVDGCVGCRGILGEVTSFLSGMKTLKDDDLHVCTLCSCFLRAKVWLPMEVVDNQGVDFTLAPKDCWQTSRR